MTECKNCEQGRVPVLLGIVSREMAMDAGDLQYEGQEEWGYVECDCCQGDWQDCPICSRKDE